MPTTTELPPCGCCSPLSPDNLPWTTTTGPLGLLRRLGAIESWEHPSWMDQTYRRRDDLPGGWLWVAEPYGISADDFPTLSFLAAQDWDIDISAERARHYPGCTVAVELSPNTSRAARGVAKMTTQALGA